MRLLPPCHLYFASTIEQHWKKPSVQNGFVFSKNVNAICQQINEKWRSIGAGIRTHDLLIVSLLPKALHQGSPVHLIRQVIVLLSSNYHALHISFLMSHPRPIFVYFRLFKHILQFYCKLMWKNVHPKYGTGIQTHYLWSMSLLP